LLLGISDSPLSVFGPELPADGFARLNLSVQNKLLTTYDITDPDQCQGYIDLVLYQNNAKVAYGGYLEQRNLYQKIENFGNNGRGARDFHLGIDLWTTECTPVLSPLKGIIHSYANNKGYGNYGPTVILQHQTGDLVFYTLYGHLSRESLSGIQPGQIIERGKKLAELGSPQENGGYAPHLHFQVIVDIQDHMGDYPGVCSELDLNFYQENCPDPNLLLKL
jgi:murein DD-endopeptidase MepM/ murein hydrolase activator NlpD